MPSSVRPGCVNDRGPKPGAPISTGPGATGPGATGPGATDPGATGPGATSPGAAVDSLAHRVLGCAIEVHRVLGPGWLESIYEEALCVELALARIPFERQVPVKVRYKRQDIGDAKLDLLVCRQLVVELKTVEGIAPVHVAQVLSYLKIKRLRLGLLVNFNVVELRQGIKRVINTPRNS